MVGNQLPGTHHRVPVQKIPEQQNLSVYVFLQHIDAVSLLLVADLKSRMCHLIEHSHKPNQECLLLLMKGKTGAFAYYLGRGFLIPLQVMTVWLLCQVILRIFQFHV